MIVFYLSGRLSGGATAAQTGDQFYNLFFVGEKEMFDINGGKDSFSRPV